MRLLLVLLAGCGVVKDDADPSRGGAGGAGTNPVDAPIYASAFAGAWKVNTCTPQAVGSSTETIFVTASENRIVIDRRPLHYTGPDCTGTTIDAGSSDRLGKVTFEPGEASGNLTFMRGYLEATMAAPTRVIWALRRPDLLCITTDGSPTSFPTPQSVGEHFEALSPRACLTKLGSE